MRIITYLFSGYIILICLITVLRIKLKEKQDREERYYKELLKQLENMKD